MEIIYYIITPIIASVLGGVIGGLFTFLGVKATIFSGLTQEKSWKSS